MLNPILLELAIEKVAIRKDERPQPPPNYRMAFGEVAKCGSCQYFIGGHCKKFKVPVDQNFVCDEYEPLDLNLPDPTPVSPGGGVMDFAAPPPISAGAVEEIKSSSDNYITPQIDQGPVTAAPLKSDKRIKDKPMDQSAKNRDRPVDERGADQINNNNPRATARIFGMATKAAEGGGAGGGTGGGGSSGGMAAPSAGESIGTSAPGGYDSYPDQQQIHRLQVGLSSGRRRKRARDVMKTAALGDPTISPMGLMPKTPKGMPNAAQGVPLPQARPLVGAQPGDPSINPGPPMTTSGAPAGPRGLPSQPTGQQGQASPTPPPAQQPAPQQPAPQAQSTFKPSPLVTLYGDHPAVQPMKKFVQPAPPMQPQQKMAGELPLESLAAVAARVKAASDAAPAPPKPPKPSVPVPVSKPKISKPTIKAAKAPKQRALTPKSLTGKAMRQKALTAKNLTAGSTKSGEDAAVVGERTAGAAVAIKSAGGGATAVESAGGGATAVKSGHVQNKVTHGLDVTVTDLPGVERYENGRHVFRKLANVALLPQLPFDPLSHDLTTPADPTSLMSRGAPKLSGGQRDMMSRLTGKGKHPGIKGKGPGRSSGYLDPATMSQVRSATAGARTALDLGEAPNAKSFFDHDRFQTLAQMASIGDQRAYSQMQDMAKALDETNADPYTARMARIRIRDLELQHPQFAKTSQVLRLGELASKELLKAAGFDWAKAIGGPFKAEEWQSLAPRIKSTAKPLPPVAAPNPQAQIPLAHIIQGIVDQHRGRSAKPPIHEILGQLRGSRAGVATPPSLAKDAPTISHKIAMIVKSAQGLYMDPRARMQQYMMMRQQQMGGQGGPMQRADPTQGMDDQTKQNYAKYQQLRQGGGMPSNMTFDRWNKSWQQTGQRAEEAKKYREQNPEFQRRPDEAGAAGFERWQDRMRSTRTALGKATPEQQKLLAQQQGESPETWQARRSEILNPSGRENPQQQAQRLGKIVNVQGRVRSWTPEQRQRMADQETQEALAAQGLNPQQVQEKMKGMSAEQRGQVNEQAANQWVTSYNQRLEALRAHEAKTPEQLAEEDQIGRFNLWQNYAVKEMAKAMGMEEPPTNMTPQQFQQKFQEMQQAGQLHDPEVMNRLQEHYKSWGYHGNMPSIAQDYNKQTWRAMNTAPAAGAAPAANAAPAPAAAAPAAAAAPTPAPAPTATPGAAPQPPEQPANMPSNQTQGALAPPATTGGTTGQPTTTGQPRGAPPRGGGGFSVAPNPAPSPGSGSNKTPYSPK